MKSTLGERGSQRAKALLACGILAIAPMTALAQERQPCIGFSGPLTGPAAFGGEAIQMGAQTAIEEINAKGGVLGKKLSLKIYNDEGAPPKGVDNVRRIALSDNCVAMLGGYHSGVALAMREPIKQTGILYIGTIAAGTTIIEHESGDNQSMFRVSAKDKWVAQTLVDVAAKRSKTGKIALFYENTGWGNGAAPDMKKAMLAKGLTPVAVETFNWGDQDMTPQLIRARDAGADSIVMFALDREGNQILRGMDKLNYKPLIVSAWGLAGNLGQLAGPMANGVLVLQTYSWMGTLDSRGTEVYNRIAEKYKLKSPADLKMGSGTANAYDAVHIIAKAIEKAGSYDLLKVREAMYSVKYDGLTAKYDPAFEKNQERHDAMLPRYYKITAWHSGALLPIEQTPYK